MNAISTITTEEEVIETLLEMDPKKAVGLMAGVLMQSEEHREILIDAFHNADGALSDLEDIKVMQDASWEDLVSVACFHLSAQFGGG